MRGSNSDIMVECIFSEGLRDEMPCGLGTGFKYRKVFGRGHQIFIRKAFHRRSIGMEQHTEVIT